MIDTKYGLHYPFPHSVVHIVDNSAYTGELPTVTAEDPSLFSTLVVTGTPMGEDNKVITVTRQDVVNVAFGLGSITSDDRSKYGQTIEYPNSLIEQGAPIRLMRVTPEGSTYGMSCIVVQWRIDPIDDRMHVRFKLANLSNSGIQFSRFKNSNRLNSALVKQYNSGNNTISENGYEWKQRVFINNISAGRGKAYNYMATAINPTSQSKRPPNIKYEFVTIDTRTDQICERFYASLVNINNVNRTDAIDTVNVEVGKRVAGSSIIVPYVNENAVKEIYNDYINHFKGMINSYATDEFVNTVYKTININTFDLIYGNYIYNGSDMNTKLPFYQVDMFNSDIPSLPETNRIGVVKTSFNADDPQELYRQFDQLTYGVSRSGDNVYVGDIYLNAYNNSGSNINLSIVAAINQYTGSITSVVIPKIHPLKKNSGSSEYTIDKSSSSGITSIFNDTTTGRNSYILNNLVIKGMLKVGNIVAQVSTNSFTLYTVEKITTEAVGDKYTLSPAYTVSQIFQSIDWNSHPSTESGVGNIIGRKPEHSAFKRIGSTVINDDDGSVWVNGYSFEYDENNEFSKGRIKVDKCSTKFGAVPSDVNITTDLVGASYDVLVYRESDIKLWKITDVEVSKSGTGYVVGETLEVINDSTVLTVTDIDASGGVTGVKITKSNPVDDSISKIMDANGSAISVSTIATDSSAGSGCEVIVVNTIKEFKSNPESINRYVVSGVQGSLFRIQKDSSVEIPSNYYSDEFGICPTSESGGVRISYGSTGFFDDETLSDIEFKWRYSALLVKAYRGEIDPRIMSPTRVPAKYLFDGGHNTIVGQTILPNLTYSPIDIINASTVFTDDEKEEALLYPETIANIKYFEDVDVKQAMYDLMIYRCYQGIPENKRPIGPGSGLSLHLDSGVTDANTMMLVNKSFAKRFDNPNASWDIGGWVDTSTGMSYTFIKQIVDNLVRHSKQYSVNKPYTGKYSAISPERYSSYFPDVDTTDWELRELLYNSGGNSWIVDVNGMLMRRSQRTLERSSNSSDLVQESNMRTLSQLVYLVQNKIDSYLLEYDDDGVLKTLSDEVNNMFSTWIGNLVDSLNIQFTRDINIDGADIVVCNINVTFRGLILRVPIIVNVNRRQS